MRWTFFLIIPLGMAFQSCASVSLQAKRVVEQSRQSRPDWVQNSTSVWRFDSPSFEYVVAKQRVIDIALGLDQAYLSAIIEMRTQVHDFLLQTWEQQGSFNILSAEERTQLEKQLQQTIEAKIDGSVVQDIYYEKIYAPSEDESLRDTYSVFVHLSLEAPQLARLLFDIKQACLESSRPGWRKFAQNEAAFPIEILEKQQPQSDLVDSSYPLKGP